MAAMNRDWLFYLSLILNIVFLLLAMGLVRAAGVPLSVFHSLLAIAGLFILLLGYRNRLLIPVHAGVMLLLIVNVIAIFAFQLLSYWWYDVVLHFLGGLFAALFIIAVTHQHIPHDWRLLLWTVALTITIGVCWEWAELILAWFDPGFGLTLSDTLGDLLADTVGGLVATLCFLKCR